MTITNAAVAAPPEHHPGQLRAILGCLLALDGIRELRQARDAGDLPTAHTTAKRGSGCAPGCAACSTEVLSRDTDGLQWLFEHALAALEGEVTDLAGQLGELAEQVRDGPIFLPDAEEIAAGILDLMTYDGYLGGPDDSQADEPVSVPAR
jgi:hypothetical protein